MEPEIIRHKLQKYFDGESNLEDERMLHGYFRSGLIDASLLPYKGFFSGLESMKGSTKTVNERELMNFILENEHREKIRYRKLWQAVTGIAAALLIALFAVHYSNEKTNWEDTYSDPDQAYAVAVQTLHFVAGKYQEGMAQLQPIAKLNQAAVPINKSLDLLNRGLTEMENFQKSKIKQEKP